MRELFSKLIMKSSWISKRIMKGSWMLSVSIAFLTLLLLANTFYTIETGEVGVLARFGKYKMEEMMPGFHWKIPFVDRIKRVDVRLRTINYIQPNRSETITYIPSSSKRETARYEITGSKGILYGYPIVVLDKRGLTVTVELTIQYQLRPQMAAEVLANYGANYEMKLIHPIVRDSVRDVVATYPAEQIPMYRNEIATNIATTIVTQIDKIKNSPFRVTAVQLRNITLPKRVAQKIQDVQLAKQEAEKMRALEEKAQREQRVRLIQAETQKQERIKKAEAERQERILRARGEAQAKLLKAEAIQKSNQMIAASITPEILRWREIAVQEKFAQAISTNPNARLFYGMKGAPGNFHYWLNDAGNAGPRKKETKLTQTEE